jgi:hypothetical protein
MSGRHERSKIVPAHASTAPISYGPYWEGPTADTQIHYAFPDRLTTCGHAGPAT